MKPVFMVIGSGHRHELVIEKVKKLGMDALVVTNASESRAALIADYYEKADVTDIKMIEKIARAYGIVGSITVAETAVPTCCYINEALSLPNQGRGISQVVRDKYLMRQSFAKNNVRSPVFYKIENEEDYRIVEKIIKAVIHLWPYIVKPTDGENSRGVTKITEFDQFHAAVEHARKNSNNGKIIVEQYIVGLEIGAQCFCINGEMALCLIHNDGLSDQMVPIAHSFPVCLDEQTVSEVKEECAKALQSLGIQNGPSNVDIIIDEDGRPHILEIGARMGGTELPQLVEAHSGIDIIEASILLASGKTVELPTPNNIPVASMVIHFDKTARVKTIENYDHLVKRYKPLEYRVDLGINTKVKPSHKKYGYVIYSGDDAKSAERQCARFIRKLKRLVEFI